MMITITDKIRQSGLSELTSGKNKVITEFVASNEQSQRDFLQAVLLESGQYDKGSLESTINLLMSYFSKVHPLATDNNADHQAYCEYISSIITRCTLSNNLSTLEKMHSLLTKNQATIKIQGAKSASIKVEQGSQYLDKGNIIVQPILDAVYTSDTQRFEQSSFEKGGLYKQGKKNPASSNIQNLLINISPPDNVNLKIGVNEKTREVFPILMPLYMAIAHEEHHGVRMLRGAGRDSRLLPTILKSSYSTELEEFVNIRAGKKSDAVISKTYELPTRLSHHASHGFSISSTGNTPDYKELFDSIKQMLSMGQKESNYQAISKTRNFKDSLSNFREQAQTGASNEKTAAQSSTAAFSPLIPMFFYNEGLDELDVIQAYIDQYKENKDLIPAKQNPVHLLAQFSYLWDPTLEANQLKKLKLVELFKRNNLDFDALDSWGGYQAPPLAYAIKAQDIQLVDLILTYGDVKKFSFEYDEFEPYPRNLLSEAITTANPELVAKIFGHLKKPENTPMLKEILLLPARANPLSKALQSHNTQLAVELLEFAEANGFLEELAKDSSILELIAKEGSLDVLKKLISSNTGIMKEKGVEILASALSSKNEASKDKIINYLCSQIQDPFNTLNKSGVSLFYLCLNKLKEIDDNYFAWVLKQTKPGPELFSQVNDTKENIMHRLIKEESIPDMKIQIFCQYCEDNKVDLNECMRQMDSDGRTPLETYLKERANRMLIRYIAQKCDLSNLNLSATPPGNKFEFSNIDLSNARLAGSNMSGRELSGANLTGANLSGVNFTGADLSAANLANANLLNADFTKTTLEGTNFFSASDLGNLGQLKQRLDHFVQVLDGQPLSVTKLMLVDAFVNNIANHSGKLGPNEKKQVYDALYTHPLFAKDHSNEIAGGMKNLANSVFGFFSAQEAAVETAAQKRLVALFKPTAVTATLNPPKM